MLHLPRHFQTVFHDMFRDSLFPVSCLLQSHATCQKDVGKCLPKRWMDSFHSSLGTRKEIALIFSTNTSFASFMYFVETLNHETNKHQTVGDFHSYRCRRKRSKLARSLQMCMEHTSRLQVAGALQ